MRSELQMNELSVRRASVEDAGLIEEMERACFSDPWSLAAIENYLRNPAVYYVIAENDGEAVGYGGMTVVADECDIVSVAVTESARRGGVGIRLASEMLDICRTLGVATVFLEHRESNAAAAALYDRLGFVPYGVRRKYYTSPTEDAVLRSLSLQP